MTIYSQINPSSVVVQVNIGPLSRMMNGIQNSIGRKILKNLKMTIYSQINPISHSSVIAVRVNVGPLARTMNGIES